MKQRWIPALMPSQEGRTAVVTGTGGLGLETAVALARTGAEVIVAGRDPAKGEAALARIRREAPGTRVDFERLDLASLASIAAFGAQLRNTRDRIDLLINNAAVMAPPRRRTTQDGFELQFGTNHLGHVALTAQLLPLMHRAPVPRVVSLSSVAARGAAMDLSDLQSERDYVPMTAYGRSKLACLLFASELQRRSDEAGWGITSIAAHPGVSRTELLPNGAGSRSVPGLVRRFLPFLFQPAAQGAWPTLFASTAPEAQPGGYYGPDRLGETRGHPAPARLPAGARDGAVAARLWSLSEELVGMRLGEAR
ncbi:SDR family oxidoreductase [Rubellimicrobium roseum]|uniref:SDR family oxidoreductase n=1 Tax=Rubellimicrobium roseum TaxID=687525 RepID=UPI003CCC86DE